MQEGLRKPWWHLLCKCSPPVLGSVAPDRWRTIAISHWPRTRGVYVRRCIPWVRTYVCTLRSCVTARRYMRTLQYETKIAGAGGWGGCVRTSVRQHACMSYIGTVCSLVTSFFVLLLVLQELTETPNPQNRSRLANARTLEPDP